MRFFKARKQPIFSDRFFSEKAGQRLLVFYCRLTPAVQCGNKIIVKRCIFSLFARVCALIKNNFLYMQGKSKKNAKMHTFVYFSQSRLDLFHKNILSLHRILKKTAQN